MAIRNIIKIDEEKCIGCGICVDSCHEGAIQMIDGKAKLVSDTYCDGLGNCLGTCPVDAITIIQREAAEYDESQAPGLQKPAEPVSVKKEDKLPCGCPGTMVRDMKPVSACCAQEAAEAESSLLANWPIQLKLVPATAPYLKGADILLAADCVAFSIPDFQKRFLAGRKLLVGCPKLDDSQAYVTKLADIITTAGPASIKVLRMEVPCCSGLVKIAEMAIALSGVNVPFEQVIVGIDGTIHND